MPTNTNKIRTRKKVTRAVTGRRPVNGVVLTAKQAQVIQAWAANHGKAFSFLDTKLANL